MTFTRIVNTVYRQYLYKVKDYIVALIFERSTFLQSLERHHNFIHN